MELIKVPQTILGNGDRVVLFSQSDPIVEQGDAVVVERSLVVRLLLKGHEVLPQGRRIACTLTSNLGFRSSCAEFRDVCFGIRRRRFVPEAELRRSASEVGSKDPPPVVPALARTGE